MFGVIKNMMYFIADINECMSRPCKNGGRCNNLVGRYSCTCQKKYTGSHCETCKYQHCYSYVDIDIQFHNVFVILDIQNISVILCHYI